MDQEVVEHVYSGKLHSHKKELKNTTCSSMDAIRDDPTKSSQKEKDKYRVISLI